jgi:hypothetical protein
MFDRAFAFLPALGLHQPRPRAPLAPHSATCHSLTPLFPDPQLRAAALRAIPTQALVCDRPLSPLSTHISQTPSLKSFPRIHFQKTRWGSLPNCGSLHTCASLQNHLSFRASSLASTFLCTFLHFFALCKKSSPAFSVTFTLFVQNTRGWGYVGTRQAGRDLAFAAVKLARHSPLATRHFLP